MISKNSKIRNLNPFLSNEGALKLGGSLQKSSLNFQEQYPNIIPSIHDFTNLLIRDAHERALYTDVPNTLIFLHEKILDN